MRVTTDLAEIDLDTVHRWLSEGAYWALGRGEDQFQEEKREPVGVIFTD